MIPVRQSTAFECAIGPVLDADGVAVTNGVVGDFKLKKTTGNFAALNGSATLTHVSAGFYDLVLTTSDTDTVGLCCVAIDDTTNACAPLYLQVIEEAVYDAFYAASATGAVPVASGGITTASFAAGAINAAAIANAAIDAATFAADVDAKFGILATGTLQSATATTAVLAAALSYSDDIINGATLVITGETGAGQRRIITDYVGATNTATVDTWTTTPDNTSTYNIYGSAAGASLSDMATAILDADASGSTTNSTLGAIINDLEDGGRLDLILDARASQASVDAIKAKTDSLTFTVAGEVDANAQSINGTAVTGDGAGTPWGPA
jgi:hypothetical protein